jgi:FAD/FMN-containing dehydrogenase
MALCDGGIVLDMSPRRGIWIDPSLRAAVAQTGCNLGDLDRETQIHGLAACVGFVSKTGIAGLTVGGGFGYLTRRFGWTSDTVRSMEVVTADGRIVRASDKENPELFWGLRGGGNNFGVVTLIEYSLHDVGLEIVGGAVAWRAEDAMSVLEMIRDLASQAPPELACVAVVRPAPPAPWLPMDVHGKLIVIALLCYSGPIDKGEKLVAPVKSFGKPIGDVLQRRSYVSQQSLLDATQPDGRRNYWKSEYLPAYLPELNSQVIEHAGRVVSPHSSVIVFRLEGALNRLPPDHSAVGNRDAHYVLNIAASWEKEADDEPNIAWARAAPGMN